MRSNKVQNSYYGSTGSLKFNMFTFEDNKIETREL